MTLSNFLSIPLTCRGLKVVRVCKNTNVNEGSFIKTHLPAWTWLLPLVEG